MYKHLLLRTPIEENNILLYAPTLGKVWKINKKSDLGWNFILNKKPVEIKKQNLDLTFLISFLCNFSCLYCYESHNDSEVLKLNTAKKVASLLIEKHNDTEKIIVNYFGGEPTLQMNFIRDFTDWIKRTIKDRKLVFTMTTNGMINNGVLNELWRYVDKLKISFDGIKTVQEYHRRSLTSNSSFTRVFQVIKNLYETHPNNISLRITITNYSVDMLSEICTFLCENFPGVPQQYEPFMDSDFAKHDLTIKDMKRFFQNFLKINDIADLYKTPVRTSFANFSSNGGDFNRFCGVASLKYTILPNGSLSSCNRVHTSTVKNTPFFIADKESYNSIKRKLYSLPILCNNCFARYNCKGGCYALRHSLNIGEKETFDFCDEIRQLIINILNKQFKKEGGNNGKEK